MQKTAGGEVFVTTSRPLERIGIDIMTITHGQYVLVAIDYFTRLMKAKISTTKETKAITRLTKDIIAELGNPKEIVADSGKEFDSGEFKAMCWENSIHLHFTSADKHQSNGRVERAIRKIWQCIRKEKEEREVSLHEIPTLVEKINNTFCRAIKTTPREAWNNPENKILIEANNRKTKYAKEFKRLHREVFETGDKVFIQELRDKNEPKINSRTHIEGVIKRALANDSYLVESKGKIIKRNHAQMRKISP